jgi:hypothetical protein
MRRVYFVRHENRVHYACDSADGGDDFIVVLVLVQPLRGKFFYFFFPYFARVCESVSLLMVAK